MRNFRVINRLAVSPSRAQWSRVVVLMLVAYVIGCTSVEDHVNNAEGHIARGDFFAAASELNAALDKRPGDIEIRLKLAQAFFSAGDLSSASDQLKVISPKGADGAEAARFLASKVAYYGGDLPGAREALGASTANARIEFWRAAVLLELHEDANYRRLMSTSVAADFTLTERALLESREALIRGDAQRAVKIVEDAQSVQKEWALEEVRSNALAFSGKRRESEQALESALSEFPDVIENPYDWIRINAVLIEIYLNTQQAEKALDRLDDLEPRYGTFHFSALARSKALLMLGDVSDAKQILLAMSAEFSDSPEVLALLGVASIEDAQPEQAEMFLRRALEIDITEPMPAVVLSEHLMRQQDPSSALSILQRVIDSGVENADIYSLYASAQLATGDLEGSSIALEQALAVSPGNRLLQLKLIANHLVSKQFAAAELAINRLDEAEPNLDLSVRARLLSALLRSGQTDFAEQLVGRWQLRTADDRVTTLLEVVFLAATDQLAAAGRKLSALQTSEPEFAPAYVVQGNLELLKGRQDQAITAFAKANELQPSASMTIRVSTLMLNSRERDAVEYLEAYVSLIPDRAPVQFFLAQMYEASGKISKSLAVYEALIEDNPENVPALNNLAWALRVTDPERAVNLAKQAYDISAGGIPAIADTYGWLLAQSGNLNDALPILRFASEGDPEALGSAYHYAWALNRSGSTDASAALLDAILRDEQAFAERDAAIELRVQIRAGDN